MDDHCSLDNRKLDLGGFTTAGWEIDHKSKKDKAAFLFSVIRPANFQLLLQMEDVLFLNDRGIVYHSAALICGT